MVVSESDFVDEDGFDEMSLDKRDLKGWRHTFHLNKELIF